MNTTDINSISIPVDQLIIAHAYNHYYIRYTTARCISLWKPTHLIGVDISLCNSSISNG